MARLSLADAMFLAAESRESMMHVGALALFEPPADAPPGYLRDMADELRGGPGLSPPWNQKLRHPDFLADPRQAWVDDDAPDVDYHLRRSGLPSPGSERELGVLVSRLHGTAVDFHRPPWEMHLVEGLADGRFGLYSKMHHSLVDGYTGMRLLASSLSTDPDERDAPLLIHRQPPARQASHERPPALDTLLHLAREQIDATREMGRAVRNLVNAWRGKEPDLPLPLRAPSTVFNRRVGAARRFATQQYEFARLKDLAHAHGGTLNDLVLALVGGALRRYLEDLDALPAEPLIAALPVNIRPKDDPGGGNAVGAILASLATHLADPRERMAAIIASTRKAKAQLEGMSKSAMLQYSALLMAPVGLQLVTGRAGRARPVFNVMVSNVPGPTETLYLRGAKLVGFYPLSIPFHGYGLNITVNGYAGTLNFGFIGCRDALPRLQRLAVYCGEALEALEAAA